MVNMRIDEVISACKGIPYGCNGKINILGVGTDSRKIKAGDLFIPLKGENFDGHDFIQTAINLGAVLVLTEKEINSGDYPYILVEDTLAALQALAKYYKSKFDIPVVAVTGSAGKTTTKDMIAAVLSQKYKVLKTEGNYNNGIGLPLTLFNLDHTHQVAVLEMGMNSLGEIQLLADIARPDIAVISNVGTAHIEMLKTKENILKAKMEICTYFNSENLLILNGDDEALRTVTSMHYRIIRYGLGEANPMIGSNDQIACAITENGELGITFETTYNGQQETFKIPIPGLHNVYNALSAICTGKAMQLTAEQIRAGLSKFKPSKMRMEFFTTKNGLKVINDVYNANPESMAAAIHVLKSFKQENRTVCILGDMFELGNHAQEEHHKLGECAAEANIDRVIAVGDMAEVIKSGAVNRGMEENHIYTFQNNQEVLMGLLDMLQSGDVVLIKGSRGMKMESIVDFLRERG